MEKIFNQAKDKNVAAIVMYASADDGYLFADSAHTSTKKLTTAEVKDAFLKGSFVVFSDAYYAPAKYAEDSTNGGACITVCADGAEYNFHSKEYTAPAPAQNP